MIKIIVKAAILVCIILSIYFIVNPSACANFLSGHVVNSTEQEPSFVPKDQTQQELLTPTGDSPLVTNPSTMTATAPAPLQSIPASSDNAQPAHDAASTYSQADIDYAIASRYVELENQYTSKQKDTKNAAKDISYIVMDDFELTPAEWEAFLQRATQNNLFEKVRAENPAK